MRVKPIPMSEVTKFRRNGETYDQLPEHLEIAMFEAQHNGTWHRIVSGYPSISGPMLWLEYQPL